MKITKNFLENVHLLDVNATIKVEKDSAIILELKLNL